MRKMNVFMALALCGVAYGQGTPGEKVTVKFSDPSKPGKLEAGLMNGSITVEGYAGNEVVIEAAARTQKVSEDEDPESGQRNQQRRQPRSQRNRNNEEEEGEEDRSKGLKKLSVMTTGLEVTEKANRMEVHVSSWMQTIDIRIRVPLKTSLELSTINGGDIEVSNVDGEIEISNLNGPIKLSHVAGTVVANSNNGVVTVSMNRVDAGKAMSFVSMNGDIDVTLPANTKALLRMKTEHGDVFSDFDIKFDQQRRVKQEDNRGKGGRYELEIENVMLGSVNGGGPEFRMETFNGNIYVRKNQQ